MKIQIIRSPSKCGATIGELLIDGVFQCYTLEDVIREIPGQPVTTWKIPGVTAIPAGVYPVTLEHSLRFGPHTLTVNDVPGFKHIRMHAGNTSADTEGCLLLGLQHLPETACLQNSRVAVALIRGAVEQAINRGESVSIEIINPPITT